MFGKYFKHVLILTILAWMTYTLPSVREALGATAYDPSLVLAATTMAPQAGMPARPPMSLQGIDGNILPRSGSDQTAGQGNAQQGTQNAQQDLAQNSQQGNQQKPDPIAALVKAGIITQDRADEARKILMSSMPQGGDMGMGQCADSCAVINIAKPLQPGMYMIRLLSKQPLQRPTMKPAPVSDQLTQ